MSLEQGEYVVKRFLKRYGGEPVAFFDLLRDGDDLNVALATKSGEKYRGKGYASELTSRGMAWLSKHKNLYNQVIWGPREENTASRKIAEKHGFNLDEKSSKKWLVKIRQESRRILKE